MEVSIVVAFLLGFLRVYGVKNQSFQAFAHIYVGGLLVYARHGSEIALYQLIALTVVETFCFIRDKLAKKEK